MDAQWLSWETKAGVIAHAIRLGKCPKAGQVIGGNMRMATANLAATEMTSGVFFPFEFVVAQEDIARAIQMINDQQATYSEPKTTVVRLAD